MKKNVLILVALVFMTTGVMSQELTLEKVLDNYYKAGAMEKLHNVQTIVMKGVIVQNDIMPLKIIKMRPDNYLMEYDVADLTAYQAYDGKSAWMTTPWTSNPKPRPMPDDRALDARNRADFDGLLYNWKNKGHVAELAGKDTVGSTNAWKIKLTRKDGGIEYYFIDDKSYLLLKKTSYRMMQGKEAEVVNYYLNYQEVEGIPFSYRIDLNLNGRHYNSYQFDTITLNIPVDEKVFRMPQE